MQACAHNTAAVDVQLGKDVVAWARDEGARASTSLKVEAVPLAQAGGNLSSAGIVAEKYAAVVVFQLGLR